MPSLRALASPLTGATLESPCVGKAMHALQDVVDNGRAAGRKYEKDAKV